MPRPSGPQFSSNNNWIRWSYWHNLADAYGEVPESNENTQVAFFHAQPASGNEGKESHMIGAEPDVVVSPLTGREYGASIRAEIPKRPTYEERTKGINRKYSLDHVQEYIGLDEMADNIGNAIDFMDVTNTDTVQFGPESSFESVDLVKNLYDKRPTFPKEFPKLSRAQFVAETLIKRRDAGIPMTPRPRKGK